jgi:hypothetical protein
MQQELAATELSEQEVKNIEEKYRQLKLKAEKDTADQIREIENRSNQLRLAAQITFAEIAGEDTKALRMQLATEERDALLANDELTAGERLKIEADYQKKVSDINKEAAAERLEILQGSVKNFQSVLTQSLDFFVGMQHNETEARVQALDAQLQAGLISQAAYDTERKKVLRKQAESDKRAAIFKATIDGAAAVVSALPNLVLAGIAGLAAALQIALIASKPIPTFARGGLPRLGIFGGKPHSKGGTKGYFDDGTVIEVEKDEAFAVVNKRGTSLMKTLSVFNEMGGGPGFASGGLVPVGGRKNNVGLHSFDTGGLLLSNTTEPVTQQATIGRLESLMQQFIEKPSYVTVEDINAVQASESIRIGRADIV